MSMQGGDEMELGKQIKMHRQEAHLSQEEFREIIRSAVWSFVKQVSRQGKQPYGEV